VLGKVEVDGGSIDQQRTFYSSLYRMVLFPNKLYEVDAAGKNVHWSPYNGQTLPGTMFAGTGFWDTFRALYPFLNLVYPPSTARCRKVWPTTSRKAAGCPNGPAPATPT
jgi:putative alpha-1,2-mannosidase